MTSHLLFSYGTLQFSHVQRDTFGRALDGRPDAIVGYVLDYLTITDPHVVRLSGTDRHPVLRRCPADDAEVPGTVFEVTAAELAAADAYEVDAYERVLVPLRSGAHAWVYVLAQ